MVQRIYFDFPDELTQLYGPGLQELARISTTSNESEVREDVEDQKLIG